MRDTLFWASCITATVVTVLTLGCATPSERAAIAQLDNWLAHKAVKQTNSVLPSEPGLADFERVAFENSPVLRAAYERWRSQVSA
ncbi:MAG: hypothetical protein IH881_15830, partial [Myxococcales bacterium]|nr:hypothetical protein [Myxococcales bacterium]